jgi:hypothetical protein
LTLAYCIQHYTPVTNPASFPPNPPSTPSADPATSPRNISRREFGRNAAIAAAASIGAPVLLTSTTTSASAPPVVPAPPSAEPEQQKKEDPLKGLTPQQVADVEAKHANILRKYGNRFSDAQKRRLRRILAQQERLLAPVRAFAVQNGDPPASVLRVSFDQTGRSSQETGKD